MALGCSTLLAANSRVERQGSLSGSCPQPRASAGWQGLAGFLLFWGLGREGTPLLAVVCSGVGVGESVGYLASGWTVRKVPQSLKVY